MPYSDTQIKKAYKLGYGRGYNQPETADPETYIAPPPGFGQSQTDAYNRGYQAGFSARRGMNRKVYLAQYYTENRDRIDAGHRRRRRQKQAVDTLRTLNAITTQLEKSV